MNTYDDDLEATRNKWWRLFELADVATKVYDEEQRTKKGKSKIVSEEEDNDERGRFLDYVPRKIRSSLRHPQQNYNNLNGASTSSSLCYLRSFEPCSSLHYITADTKSPPNPNSQSSCLTENKSRKRRAVVPITRNGCTGKFKKIKIASLPRMDREKPEWLVRVMRKMEIDEDPRVVFERTLSASDVNPNQSRLLIPFSMLTRNDFLTPAETQAIEREDVEEENVGVGTILVTENSKMWGLRFKIWAMMKKNTPKGTLNYALNWGWNDVVEGNNLKAGDEISLWYFRRRGVLCFALEHIVHWSKGFAAAVN